MRSPARPSPTTWQAIRAHVWAKSSTHAEDLGLDKEDLRRRFARYIERFVRWEGEFGEHSSVCSPSSGAPERGAHGVPWKSAGVATIGRPASPSGT